MEDKVEELNCEFKVSEVKPIKPLDGCFYSDIKEPLVGLIHS